MSNPVQPHREQPTRLPRPWDSPGENTGVGCHFLLHRMKVKSESEVAQLCPTLRDRMDCSPPGSSVHGIFQSRVLEWGAIPFFGGIFLSQEIEPGSPTLQADSLLSEPPIFIIASFMKRLLTLGTVLLWWQYTVTLSKGCVGGGKSWRTFTVRGIQWHWSGTVWTVGLFVLHSFRRCHIFVKLGFLKLWL